MVTLSYIIRKKVFSLSVLGSLFHPFIINLAYASQWKLRLYMVLADLVYEFVNSGDLFHHIARSACFDENTTRFYAAKFWKP